MTPATISATELDPIATPVAVNARLPSPITTDFSALAIVDALGPIAIELFALAPVLSILPASLDLTDTYL